MKILECDQGSVEWALSRVGRPTASGYDRILTAKTLRPSAARDLYCAELLAEYLLGQPIDWGTSAWAERGTEMEEEARRWYEFDQDVEVEEVGFIARDDDETGGSPDGLVVGRKKGLEIKCFQAANHMLQLLDFHDKAPAIPFAQVQGCLYLTDYEEWDVLYYNPSLPRHIVRVYPDEKWRAAFIPVLDDFIGRLNAEKKKWEHVRNLHPLSPEIQAELKADEEARKPESGT